MPISRRKLISPGTLLFILSCRVIKPRQNLPMATKTIICPLYASWSALVKSSAGISMFCSCKNLAEPRLSVWRFMRASTPLPGTGLAAEISGSANPLTLASSTMASAMGWSIPFSMAAASASSLPEEMPLGKISVTAGAP